MEYTLAAIHNYHDWGWVQAHPYGDDLGMVDEDVTGGIGDIKTCKENMVNLITMTRDYSHDFKRA